MSLYLFSLDISKLVTFFTSAFLSISISEVNRLSQWGYIFYSVTMNYYYPTSVTELREGMERSMDRGAMTLKVDDPSLRISSPTSILHIFGGMILDIQPLCLICVQQFPNTTLDSVSSE